jgi:peptide/nickel transport system permease protein
MFVYLVRSLAQGILVLMTVALIAFSIFRFVGDPVANMLGQEATLQDRQELSERLGLDLPWPLQFVHFMENASKGEFGVSFRQGRKVSDLIKERLPATVELAVISAILATGVGILLGVYAAINKTGIITHFIMMISLVGVSLPTFLIGIGLIYIFAVELRWLPSFGRGETVKIGWWSTGLLTESGRKSLIMPVLTLSFFQLTLIMRLVRAEMLEVMRAEFIRFARARGISERIIELRYALRNTLVPVVTIAGLQLGSVIAFAIVTETVFQWPGLGALFVNAVQFADVPVMAAYLMFVAAIFVLVNLVVDLLYFGMDPRLRTGSRIVRGGD